MHRQNTIVVLLLSCGSMLAPGGRFALAARPGADSDAQVLDLFSRKDPALYAAFKKDVRDQNTAKLLSVTCRLAASDASSAWGMLRAAYGVEMSRENVERAIVEARELSSACGAYGKAAGGAAADRAKTIDGGLEALAERLGSPDHQASSDFFNRRSSKGSQYDEYDPRDNRHVHASIHLFGGGGNARGTGFKTGGATMRFPLLPNVFSDKSDTNKHGNMGLEIGLIVSGGSGGNRVLSQQTLSSCGQNCDVVDVVRRVGGGMTTVEVLGLGYQTPTFLKFLSADIGMRMAYISMDTRKRTLETISRDNDFGYILRPINADPSGSYGGSGSTCDPFDPRTIPDGYECVHDARSTVLSETELSREPGVKYNGLGGVAYAAVNAAVSRRWALRFEATRTTAPGHGIAYNGYRGGVVFNWSKGD